MASEVYMDVPAVQDMAKTFGTIGEVLTSVADTLQGLVELLKATAFIGLVGGAAVISFIEAVRPPIDEMAEKCAELNQDLIDSSEAYARGDEQGATRFH